MRSFPTIGTLTVALLLTFHLSTAAHAAMGDCGQPVSTGTQPSAADSLLVLKESVGQVTACDDSPCTCDVDGNESITATDALLILKKAVGHAVALNCPCPPLCDYVPFTPTVDEVVEAFAYPLDSSGDLDVPSSCGSSAPLCCPGGTPQTPCGPLHFDFVPQEGESGPTLTQLADPNQFAFDIPVRVNTKSDLPVTVPVVGECGLRIDTSVGDPPRINVQGIVEFSADRISITPVGTVTITGLTSQDLALTGSLACTAANFGLDFVLATLTDVIEENLTATGTLCRACDTNELVPCGP